MNLYEILGVSTNATAEELKAAYRKKARSAHPDAGGSAEAFRALQAAFDALSDPDKRRVYDETGENAGASLSRIEEMLKDCIAPLIVQAGALRGDVLEKLRVAILEQVEERRSRMRIAAKKLEDLAAKKGGYKNTGKGPNLFEMVIAEAESAVNAQIACLEADTEDAFAMLEVLAGYEFCGGVLIGGDGRKPWTQSADWSRRMMMQYGVAE